MLPEENSNQPEESQQRKEPPWPLPESDEELLEQCEVETFRSGGKGGQHVNKTESGVRLRHMPSGITAICTRERSQYLNKQLCINNLRHKIEIRNRPQVPRIATKVPRSVKRKRIFNKKVRGQQKQLRRKSLGENE